MKSKQHKIIYKGENATIYKLYHPDYHSDVAVKVLNSSETDYYGKLKNEYEILQKLGVSGVPKALELSEFNGSEALYRNYVKGISLKQFIENNPFNLELFLSISIRIVDVLSKIHKEKIIHGDLASDNILISNENQIEIIDFELSRHFSLNSNPLKTDMLRGTAHYISPEQTGKINRRSDYRSDLYSVGAILYELFTGVPVFPSDSLSAIIHAHLTEKATAPKEHNKTIPEVLSSVILKLLSKNPAERYQSAAGLKADLKRVLISCQTKDFRRFELGEDDYFGVPQFSQSLVGRDAEIRTLNSALQQSDRGKSILVTVEGASGTGKTMLVNEFVRQIRSERIIFIQGKFEEYTGIKPYSVILTALKKFIHSLLKQGENEINYWKHLILNGVKEHANILSAFVPEIELIIGKQPDKIADLEGEEAKNRLFYVLGQFIRIIGRKDHPLVFFIDDYQRVDKESAELLSSWLDSADIEFTLFIFAFRGDETALKTIDSLKQKNILFNALSLKNFSIETLTDFVKNSLMQKLPDIENLGRILYEKTNGNPFFLQQFFISLYNDNLIRFNFELNEWDCDLERISKKKITENVIEFLKAEFNSLPAETQNMLKTAACIGSRFNLGTIADVTGESPVKCYSAVKNTPADTFLIHLKEDQFIFAHDKLQQAVYLSTSDSEREEIHYKSGRYFKKLYDRESADNLLFDHVWHWHTAANLLNREEKQELAQLSLAAADKAKNSAAYHAAYNYLEIAHKLKGKKLWSANYNESLCLHNELCELAFLSGQYKKTEYFAEEIARHAKIITDKVRSSQNLLKSYRAQSEYTKNVEAGFKILSEFNMHFPKSPKLIHLIISFIQTRFVLRNISPAKLKELKFVADKDIAARVELITVFSSSVYAANRNYTPLFIFKTMRIIAKHGHTPNSPHIIMGYGMILAAMNRIPKAVEFGKAATDIIETHHLLQMKSKAILVRLGYIDNWVKTPFEIKPELYDNYLFAVKQGDFEFAGISLYIFAYSHFHSHNQLSDVKAELVRHLPALRKLKQTDISKRYDMLLQVIENLQLQTLSSNQVLRGNYFDKENDYRQISEDKDFSSMSYYHINSLFLYYLFDLKDDINAELPAYAEKIAPAQGSYFFAFSKFIHSLSLIRCISELNAKKTRRTINKNIEQLKKWAKHNPKTFKHKLYLVQAELASVSNKPKRAKQYYDLAIADAAKHGFIIEEALAWENTGRFYYFKQNNKTIAGSYLRTAYKKYKKWGAKAKLNQLETAFPDMNFDEENYVSAAIGENLYSTSLLDLKSIKKANESLLSEIKLDSLLKKLLNVLMENTGADYVVIINNQDNEYFVEAQASKDSGSYELLESVLLEEYTDLPLDLINYSIKTKNNIAIDDISQDENFSRLAYFKNKQVKSVLSYPIKLQTEIKAVLYLENRLTSNVFSLEKLSTLNIISSQIAISVENALLYKNLEDLVTKRTRALKREIQEHKEARTALLKSEKGLQLSNAAKDRIFSIIAHDLRGPFGSITALTEILNSSYDIMSEDEKKEIINVINNSTQKTYKLLENLLTWSRSQLGVIRYIPKNTQLQKAVNEVLDTLKPQIDKKQLKVTNAIADETNLYADGNMLETIFRNLISNAVKFTPKNGTIKIHAEKLIAETKPCTKITVSDSGVGIKAGTQERLFTVSRTKLSKGTEGEPGTGLGLIICKEFTDKHGGKIWAESEPGKGSDFIFTIPDRP